MSDDNPQKQLNIALDYLELLSKQDLQGLQKKLYSSFSALAYLALEAKKADFKPGWAQNLLDHEGHPIFTEDQANTVEMVTLNAKPMFHDNTQEGGDVQGGDVQGGDIPMKPFSTKGMIESSGIEVGSVNPDDLSLDKTFLKVKGYIAGLDKQTHDLSRELGPYRFFYDMPTDFRVPIPIPFPPYTILVPVSPRAIPVLISVFVESIRLLFSFGPLSNDNSRKILSIVVAITDILQGDWKQGILSLLGYFGSSPLLLGIVGKVFLNTFSLIAPDIQDAMVTDSYKSMKSLVAGFVFWVIATFSPDAIRQTIRLQFDKMKDLVNNANEQIEKIEGSMQKSVAPLGLKINFNKIPDNFIPTFDDIQNLQSIARQPAVYCSKDFQEAIEPLKIIPPARLILELFNIPTDPITLKDECQADSSIEQTMEKSLMPEITMDPESPLQISKGPEGLTNALKAKVPEIPSAEGLTNALKAKVPEIPSAEELTNALKVPELKVPKLKVPELKVPGIPITKKPFRTSIAPTRKGGYKKKRYTKKASRS